MKIDPAIKGYLEYVLRQYKPEQMLRELQNPLLPSTAVIHLVRTAKTIEKVLASLTPLHRRFYELVY